MLKNPAGVDEYTGRSRYYIKLLQWCIEHQAEFPAYCGRMAGYIFASREYLYDVEVERKRRKPPKWAL